MKRRILFVTNNPAFFVSHRLNLALGIRDAGFEVHVAGPRGPGMEAILSASLPYHPVSLLRGFQHPLQELRTVTELARLYRLLRPALVHHLTIKPVIYGSFAASLAGRPLVVNAITGLGYGFLAEGMLGTLVRKALGLLYRGAFASQRSFGLFQNPEDRDLFVKDGCLPLQRSRIIGGTGIDPELFRASPEPPGTVTVLLVSRLLRHKGIYEFAEAGRLLKAKSVPARLVLVGEPDPRNPASVPLTQVKVWQAEGVIEYWGSQRDMPAIYAQGHIVCLPSYREGFSRVLLEGAACGRALAASDVPGCRELVRDGVTGLLFPARDGQALADVLERLIGDSRLRAQLAAAARDRVLMDFNPSSITRATLKVYAEAGLRPYR